MSKYIDADKLIAEIKRRVFEDYNGPDSEQNEIAQGAVLGLLPFIASLQQEQPESPSNLDEAAKEYNRNYTPFEQCDSRDIIRVFKAGAEWMAGQGETHELTVERPLLGPPMICCPVHADNGDKVVVQIRKK